MPLYFPKYLKSLATFCFPSFKHRHTLELDELTIETANHFTNFYLLLHGSINLKWWEGTKVIFVYLGINYLMLEILLTPFFVIAELFV